MSGGLLLEGEAVGVERLGVIPDARVPVRRPLADDEEGAGWDAIAADLVRALGAPSEGVDELFAIIDDRTGFGLDPGSAGSLVTVGDLAGLRAL